MKSIILKAIGDLKMIYILLSFAVTVKCSAFYLDEHNSQHHYNHLTERQDSRPGLSNYFVPVVAISFFTSLFSNIGIKYSPIVYPYYN